MKRKIIRAVGMGFGVLVLAVAGAVAFVTTALPGVGPPPDLKVEGTAAQVERGRYLANHVAVCMDCHSRRDHSRVLVMDYCSAPGQIPKKRLARPSLYHQRPFAHAQPGEIRSGRTLSRPPGMKTFLFTRPWSMSARLFVYSRLSQP